MRLEIDSLLVSVRLGRVRVSSGPGPSEVVLTTTPETLLALLRRGLGVDEAIAAGRLVVSGDRADARRFFDVFRMPG